MDTRGRSRIWVSCGAMVAAALVLSACDPPGKPKLEEASAESGAESLDFATLYKNNCAGCHGVDGKNGPGRILNDGLYLSFISKEQLKQVLVNGRPGTAMPGWSMQAGGPLSDKQIDALVDGIFQNWSKPQSTSGPKPPAYEAQAGSAGNVTHGKQLFVRSCFMCHGKGAKVGPVTDPAYLSLVSDQMLRTSIVVGRPDLGMPDYRFLNLGKPLSDGDVTDLVAYLVSLRPPEAAIGQSMGTGQPATTKGNEGSGNGPGSSRHQENEGNKGKGSSSQQGVK
jgi:cytochrome c oxidase cbb3-type subunit III